MLTSKGKYYSLLFVQKTAGLFDISFYIIKLVHFFLNRMSSSRLASVSEPDVEAQAGDAGRPFSARVQRLQAVAGQLFKGPGVEVVNQHADKAVQLSKGEKGLVSQSCQNPAINDLNANLHFRFVPRFSWACRDHRHLIMPGQLLAGRI